jgi:hypothetical protein
MLHLDYLSCFLTVLATMLVVRKSWTGLVVAIANSLIVCLIGLRTSQFGFVPANLFCVGVYAFSIRSWLKERTRTNRDEAEQHGFAAHTRLKVESVSAPMDPERRTSAVSVIEHPKRPAFNLVRNGDLFAFSIGGRRTKT